MRGEPQPQTLPSAIASSSATRPAVRSSAPGMSRVALARSALEGTTRITQRRAEPLTAAPNQKAAESPRPSAMSPLMG